MLPPQGFLAQAVNESGTMTASSSTQNVQGEESTTMFCLNLREHVVNIVFAELDNVHG